MKLALAPMLNLWKFAHAVLADISEVKVKGILTLI